MSLTSAHDSGLVERPDVDADEVAASASSSARSDGTGARRRWRRTYDGFVDFYQDAYGEHITALRRVGRRDATLVEARQSTGDWSEAPTPDLTIGWLTTVDKASATLDLGAGRFGGRLRTGDGILIPPGVPPVILADGLHVCRLLSLPFDSLLDWSAAAGWNLPRDGDFGSLHAGFLRDRSLTYLLEELWREAEASEAHSSLIIDGLMLQIVGWLLRLRDDGRRMPDTARGGLAPWQLRRVVEHLEANLAEDVRLASLAELVQLSTSYFTTAFRITMGEPPHRWLIVRRVERAKGLLADPGLSITDVALAVGFGSSAHFATVFRKQVGVTPTDYRRERLL